MKKQPKTNDEFWEIIHAMEWGKSQDYAKIAREWYAELGKAGMRAAKNFVGQRVGELYHAVEKYEATGGELYIGSDDGMSDLIHHVVGLGEAHFKANLEDPSLLQIRYQKRDYTESFAYCFLEPEPPRTQAQKEMAMIALQGAVKTVQDQFSAVQKAMLQLEQDMDALVRSNSIVEMDKKSA